MIDRVQASGWTGGMPASSDRPERLHPARDQPAQDGGARAILRVPEVLMEIAASRRGLSLAELDARLSIPKASLHRILRELERGGYLIHAAGGYRLGQTVSTSPRWWRKPRRPGRFPPAPGRNWSGWPRPPAKR